MVAIKERGRKEGRCVSYVLRRVLVLTESTSQGTVKRPEMLSTSSMRGVVGLCICWGSHRGLCLERCRERLLERRASVTWQCRRCRAEAEVGPGSETGLADGECGSLAGAVVNIVANSPRIIQNTFQQGIGTRPSGMGGRHSRGARLGSGKGHQATSVAASSSRGER